MCPFTLPINSGDLKEITDKEMVAFSTAMTGGMYLWENSYYQYREGFLPEEHWTRTQSQMKSILADAIPRNVATGSLPHMRPEFREELQRVIAEVSEGTDR